MVALMASYIATMAIVVTFLALMMTMTIGPILIFVVSANRIGEAIADRQTDRQASLYWI